MLRASQYIPVADMNEPADGFITLTKDQRHRRRICLTSDEGVSFLLDLPQAVQLAHGDGLKLDDGRIFQVASEPEELMAVRARDMHHMLVLAWHLGNRHLEAQIEAGRILVRRDHVIEDMLKLLGAAVEMVVEPFSPEGGAYGGAHQAHHHHHGHNHDDDHHHHGHASGHSHGGDQSA
jgi:urease accessory protein